jgi:hypothetical protein
VKRLADFPLAEWLPAAEACDDCGAPYEVQVLEVDPDGDFGLVQVRAPHRPGCVHDGDDAVECTRREGHGCEKSRLLSLPEVWPHARLIYLPTRGVRDSRRGADYFGGASLILVTFRKERQREGHVLFGKVYSLAKWGSRSSCRKMYG